MGKIKIVKKIKNVGYAGSLMQLSFGEKPENHGFLLWEIDDNKNITHKEYNLQNDYSKITFRTKKDFDYDNIDFNHSLATKKSEFRVVWEDYSSNIVSENENKLKKYISNWNTDLRFDKKRIYTNVASSQILTETIDITNKQVQQDIFRDYLTANKYKSDFIDEILKIDDIIDDRMDLSIKINNVEWSIDKLWVDNFKSYDKFVIEWSDVKSSIIQIGGENQQGKTTILDAISYVSHGTTISTNKLGGGKKEKHGDNRYINNKRTLNYCEGGMVVDVNGEKYTLVRRTERIFKKDKVTISSCPTSIEYYTGTKPDKDNLLRGERKTDTQKMLDSIIGDFDDFIRLTLTNSENLNHLISLDRATFIDSVIKDAGFDIFEKKLTEFKKYKDTLNTKRVDINLNDAEEEVSGLKDLLKTYKSVHDEVQEEITEYDDKIKKVHIKRDVELKKLHKIDDDVADIDIADTNNKIEEYKTTIETNLIQQKNNSDRLNTLKSEYDKEEYETLLKDIKRIDDEVLNLKLKNGQEDSKIEKEKNNITRVHDKVKQLKDKEINEQKSKLITINNDIEKIGVELENAILEKKRELLDQKKTKEFEGKELQAKLKNIKEKGSDKKKLIKDLEESKVCPTCERIYGWDVVDGEVKFNSEHKEHIETKVNELNDEISGLLKIGKATQSSLLKTKSEIDILRGMIDDLEDGKYGEHILAVQSRVEKKLSVKKSEIELIDTICGEIMESDYTNVPELEANINKGLIIKTKSESTIKSIENNIKSIKQEIKDKGTKKSNIQDKVYIIEQVKEEVKTYNILLQDNKELSLKIENIKLTIENAKAKIDKYYNQLKYIDENKTINVGIVDLDYDIVNIETERKNANERLASIMKEASVTKDTIKDIQGNIKKYLAQIKQDELFSY